MYHNFSGSGATDPNTLNVEGIRIQFEYLRRHFKVVPLRQIADLASGGERDASMVALTIDDGRRNCYEFLFPMLQEFELPANLLRGELFHSWGGLDVDGQGTVVESAAEQTRDWLKSVRIP